MYIQSRYLHLLLAGAALLPCLALPGGAADARQAARSHAAQQTELPLGALAGRHAELQLHERHLANQVDDEIDRNATPQRADRAATSLQAVSKADSQEVTRETHLDAAAQGATGVTVADLRQDRALDRREEHLANELDYRLSNDRADARAEDLADRLQRLSAADNRLARTQRQTITLSGTSGGDAGSGAGTGSGAATGAGSARTDQILATLPDARCRRGTTADMIGDRAAASGCGDAFDTAQAHYAAGLERP